MRAHKFYQGKALDQELRSIYEDRGKLPDMTRLEHEYHRRTTRILIGLVLFFAILTAASWGGFFLYGPKTGSGSEVTVSIDAPEAVVSGMPQTVTVHYKNTDRNPLALATLTVRPVSELVIKDSDPKPSEEGQLHWNLGTLGSKQEGEVKLTVVPYGTIDRRVELEATVTYKPANFNAEFQANANHEFIVRATGAQVTIQGPSNASPGNTIELTAQIENTTDIALENIRALLTLPGGFTVSDMTPKVDNSTWEIGTLDPGQKQELRIKGDFVTNASGDQKVSISVEQKNDKTSLPLSEGSLNIAVSGSDIATELIANNTPGLSWIRLGQPLHYVFKITNNSSQSFENVTATLAIDSSLIDTKSIQTEGAVSMPKISFLKTGGLALAPKETKEFTVALTTATGSQSATSPFIDANGQVVIGNNTFSSPPLKLIVVSDLSLATSARYFGADGKPVGSGPLPPKVGEETVYEVRLSLHNTFHDLSNIAVIASLPSGVHFVSSAQGAIGKITSNEKTREVRWEIGRMPVTTPELNATFKIAVKPLEADRGKLMALLGITRVEAFDAISQVSFSNDAPSLSSSLEADPLGQGKGVVQ